MKRTQPKRLVVLAEYGKRQRRKREEEILTVA